jgi:hypothetical protein
MGAETKPGGGRSNAKPWSTPSGQLEERVLDVSRYAEKGFYGHAAAGTRKDKMLIWESSVAIGAIEVNGS